MYRKSYVISSYNSAAVKSITSNAFLYNIYRIIFTIISSIVIKGKISHKTE
jgi:hypothetical protein